MLPGGPVLENQQRAPGAGDGAAPPAVQVPVPDERLEWLNKMQGWLMVIATLVAGITSQVGVTVPGGIWQRDDNRELPKWLVRRYDAFTFFNATSFVMSLAIIALLIKASFFHSRTRLSVLRLAIVLDLVGLTGAFVAGSFRKLEWSLYVVLLVVGTFCILVYRTGHLGALVDRTWRRLLPAPPLRQAGAQA
ncbi:hypothetical protein ABZP36_021821 [Zizania latifolia]